MKTKVIDFLLAFGPLIGLGLVCAALLLLVSGCALGDAISGAQKDMEVATWAPTHHVVKLDDNCEDNLYQQYDYGDTVYVYQCQAGFARVTPIKFVDGKFRAGWLPTYVLVEDVCAEQ